MPLGPELNRMIALNAPRTRTTQTSFLCIRISGEQEAELIAMRLGSPPAGYG